MTPEKMIDLLICISGLYSIFRFRYLGRLAIEQRKKLNRILPFKQPEKDFNEEAVSLTQFLFLLVGIVGFLGSFIDLVSNLY